MTQSTLSVNTSAGAKRPRTVTAQGDALVLQNQNQAPHAQQQQAQDQVVVGISASVWDDVEDWSEDFMELTPRGSNLDDTAGSAGRSSERVSGETSEGEVLPRMLRSFPRASALLQRSSLGRRSWSRQRSFDSGHGDGERTSRSSRLRKSTNEASGVTEDNRGSVQSTSASLSLSLVEAREAVGNAVTGAKDSPDYREQHDLVVDGGDVNDEDAEPPDPQRTSVPAAPEDGTEEIDIPTEDTAVRPTEENNEPQDDDDEEEEDWDVEFGFAEAPDDDLDDPKPGTGGAVDLNRRRADNFNIFLRGFHDMMEGDDLLDEDDELSRVKWSRNSSDEPLFQRRRSEYHTATSVDGSVDALRSSLTSMTGSTEYTLVDKYRLLDVACSSAYAVRIERYPKACVTFSNLERDTSLFPMITDNKLEQWLENVVQSKINLVSELMAEEQANTPNPRQQKNHQFRTLVSIPFGKRFADRCFKQISVYRFYGEEKSNRELIRVFFEKLATAGIANDKWSSKLSPAELVHIAGIVLEVLQEAARMYGPVPASGVIAAPGSTATSSSAHTNNSATAFWMRQFQTILTICVEAFPTYRHVIAMIELRFVCHHLVGLAHSDLSYSWQVCNQYPVFTTLEPIAGQSAPIIANEILQYYGALVSALQSDVDSEVTHDTQESANDIPLSKYCLATDSRCLLAMVICDIQTIYGSRSALCEVLVPELVELFELEEEDTTEHDHHGFPRREGEEDSPSKVDHPSVLELLRPSSRNRRFVLEQSLYQNISMVEHPLIKARCAAVLSNMAAAAAAVTAASSSSGLKMAESLGFEALRILEWVTAKRLTELTADEETGRKDPLSSVFSSDGLLSELGREVLENLGSVLVKNQKYRYGILCLEAATGVYKLLNQGRDHERLDRLMCTLTTQSDDVKRALPLHEKVASSCLRQGNVNEYVFLTQALTNLWIREGKFSRAEEYLSSAFHFLRDQTSVLPPFFLSSLAGSYSGSEGLSSSSRSGTVLTTSSTASSSTGSFILSSRGNTSELDLWLNHDLSLHLLLRDLYRASGRFIEGMRVLEYVLGYSVRLPRGKRTQLRMLLAEDALKLRVFDTTRYMFHLLDQEANFFCDRLLQSTIGGGLGSSSGGFGSSSGGGGSSNGGRSMGGMGSEARFCFDMVLSIRYMVGRSKLYLHIGELRHAYAWSSLAHIKNERESVRYQAKLHVLDARVLFELLRRQHEHRLFPERGQHQRAVVSVDEMLQSFSSSLYALNKVERNQLRERMNDFCVATETPEKTLELGVQAYWRAFDHYQALDDCHHQLKSLLGVIQFQLAPIERSFFALGSSNNDELLVSLLGTCAVTRRSTMLATSESEVAASMQGGEDDELDDSIERVRKTLIDTQRLLRRALSLSEQIAEPTCYFRTLTYCSQTWTWLERLAPYKSARQIKEGAAFWEEAVKMMNAVFLRRVAFEYDPQNRQRIQQVAKSGRGGNLGSGSSTYSLVPILNFRESVIVRLEAMTLQLIMTACQLQHFDRVPEYVEEALLRHMDELLSARLCLNGIAHQLRSFRSQQQQSVVRHIPLHSVPGPSAFAAKPSGESTPRTSFSSPNTVPGPLPTTSIVGASGTKRKGHKKNQSMSSISELLASSTPGPSSFHDLSLSFVSASGRGTMLSGGATPRTGLASLSDRSIMTFSKNNVYAGSTDNSSVATSRSPAGSDGERETGRSRGRSRSAPQPLTPVGRGGSNGESRHAGMELSPVNESSASSIRVVDLKDVRLWSFGDGDEQFNTNDGASSTGAIGIYDFDDVQSERLWWIFNSWRGSKESYISGKTEFSAFRHQNLKTLRLLLDAFDPQQVAVLYSGGKTGSSNGMLGFDVAHMSTHALVEDRSYVLSIGYDDVRGHSTHPAHLDFKVFKVLPNKTSSWRAEIPHADWYLSAQYNHSLEGDAGTNDSAVLRILKRLGAKLVLKLLGVLLLENSLVVVGSSFPLIKEVMLCLLKLLRPFHWHHTFLPFLPVTSWRFLADSLNHYVQAQAAERPKSKISLSSLSSSDWRWGSPRPISTPLSSSSASRATTSQSSSPVEAEDEPPFFIGTMSDTWQTCMQRLKTSSTDERAIPTYVNVLDLDDIGSFSTAKSSTNSVSFPRKWRKQFLERFDKTVKQRRKAQDKMGRRTVVEPQTPATSSARSVVSVQSPASTYARSQHSYTDAAGTPRRAPHMAGAASGGHDRALYDAECASSFVNGVQEFYDRLCTLTAERAKKLKGKKAKKHSKRHEIKSWFSSSHEFDAFVEQFLESTMYERYELERQRPPRTTSSSSMAYDAMPSSLSRSSSITNSRMGHYTAATLAPMPSLARSFGSMSSNSSFNGPPTSHHQL